MTEGKRYVVFCDGSSNGKVGPGGWGVVICSEDGEPQEMSGGECDTTNNRMEIMAVIQAIEALPQGATAMIVSDSAYVINCMRERWYATWRHNGWRNARKQPVENQDLWERLLDALVVFSGQIRWQKTKGHTKAGKYKKGNDRADELAVQAKKELEAALT